MTTSEQRVVVLFTDISGYTQFVSSKGSAAAMSLLRQHNLIVRPVIEQFCGTFVKSTGDGIIAYFANPREAVEATVVVQQRLAAYNMGRKEHEEIHIRAGLHIGEAVIEPDEIIGHAVNYAARLVGVCGRDQIVISKQLHRSVKRLKHLAFKKKGYTQLHGISEPQEVFEVHWDLPRLEEKKKAKIVPATAQTYLREHLRLTVMVVVFLLALTFLWSNVTGFLTKSNRSLPSTTDQAQQHFDLAMEYQRHGDDEQALATLEQAIEADRHFANAYLEAAFIHNEF